MSNKNNLTSKLNNVNKQLNKLRGNNSNGNNKKSNFKMPSMPSMSSNKVFIAIGVVLLVIVLAVGGYFLYRYLTSKKALFTSKMLIPYIYDAQLDKMFTNSSIPSNVSGNEYNINMWIYISDYQYRNDADKCILFKGDINSSSPLHYTDDNLKQASCSIWLAKGVNTLTVCTGLDTHFSDNDCPQTTIVGAPTKDCSKTDGVSFDKCHVEDFPIQRWVNLNVSLRNNVLDIFMDGSLVKSCILEGTPVINKDNLYISKTGSEGMNGFNGYLSKLEYTNKSLSVDNIMKRYKNGPTVTSGSSFF